MAYEHTELVVLQLTDEQLARYSCCCLLACCRRRLLLTSQEQCDEADDVAHGEEDDERGAGDPVEEVSWVGGEDEVDDGDVGAVTEDAGRQRDERHAVAEPAVAGWEQQCQRRRGRLERRKAEDPAPERGFLGGLRVRQVDAPHNNGGLHDHIISRPPRPRAPTTTRTVQES